LLAKPRPLPRMDFSKGIPQELRTLVVIPAMLTSTHTIEDLIEALEVRFLANRDEHLHFGLLTDFTDAIEETVPKDAPLLQLARQRIETLNEKYPARPAIVSSSFIARAAGILWSGFGWGTSASAASFRI